MSDPTPSDDAGHAPPNGPDGPRGDGREAMEEIAREMDALIGRMIAFQEEMAPYLRLLEEPEDPPGPPREGG